MTQKKCEFNSQKRIKPKKYDKNPKGYIKSEAKRTRQSERSVYNLIQVSRFCIPKVTALYKELNPIPGRSKYKQSNFYISDLIKISRLTPEEQKDFLVIYKMDNYSLSPSSIYKYLVSLRNKE